MRSASSCSPRSSSAFWSSSSRRISGGAARARGRAVAAILIGMSWFFDGSPLSDRLHLSGFVDDGDLPDVIFSSFVREQRQRVQSRHLRAIHVAGVGAVRPYALVSLPSIDRMMVPGASPARAAEESGSVSRTVGGPSREDRRSPTVPLANPVSRRGTGRRRKGAISTSLLPSGRVTSRVSPT